MNSQHSFDWCFSDGQVTQDFSNIYCPLQLALCGVSVHSVCPFVDWVLFLVLFILLFTHINQILTTCQICSVQNFLPLYWLSLYFSDCFLCYVDVFQFHGIPSLTLGIISLDYFLSLFQKAQPCACTSKLSFPNYSLASLEFHIFH